MKKTLMLLAMVLVALPALAGGNPHKTPSGWFDMENCEFCKHLVADPAYAASLARSTDPKVVAKMHEMARRNTEEMAIMMGGAVADPHAGHKH